MSEVAVGGQRRLPVGEIAAWVGIEDVKVCIRYIIAATFYVTINPEIKTVYDLEGKTIAFGRKTQTVWAMNPQWNLERDLGIHAEPMYTGGPTGGVRAMLEGKADAAIMMVNTDWKGSQYADTAAYIELQTSPVKFYYVSYPYDEATIALMTERSAEMKAGVEWVTVFPAGLLIDQGEPLGAVTESLEIGCHKNLRDDIAYEFTKFAIEHLDELAEVAPAWGVLTKEDLVAGTGKYFHPASLKAGEEFGLR